MEGIFYGMYMNHQANKHDEWYEENHGKRESYKKGSSREQGMLKTQVEIVEVEKASLCTQICSLNFSLIVECLRMTKQKILDSITSQTRGPG